MFDMKKTTAIVLSAASLCILLAGCGQTDPQPTDTVPTTQTTAPAETATPTEATDPTVPTEAVTPVPVQFKGLRFHLDDTYTTGEEDGKFTFRNAAIQGGVESDSLSKLTGGFAQTSGEYATYLQKELQDDHEKVWVGSSTGIGFYIVFEDPDQIRVQCLYVKGNNAWNIWAESSDSAQLEELIRICGKCSMVSEETAADGD